MSEEQKPKEEPAKAEKKTTEVSINKPRPGKLRTTVIRRVCCGRSR